MSRPARRRTNQSQEGPHAARVLVVSPDAETCRRLRRLLHGLGLGCVIERGPADALVASERGSFDLAIAHDALAGNSAIGLIECWAERGDGPVPILMADHIALDDALVAMRAGAADLIATTIGMDELRERLARSIEKAAVTRRQSDRIERLRRLCKKLNDARQQVSRQVGALCSDLATAYDDLAGQLDRVSLASEFRSVIRGELEIEELLRVAMEYVLAKVGPTNAAAYLPDTAGDFSLGAYVNYDRPRETAEVLFDRLADVLACRFEHDRDVVQMCNDAELEDRLGDESHWLDGQTLLAVPCVHDGECLAVVTLFRDERSQFPEDLLPTLRVISDVFAEQLARVIHVHHRHVPKDQWGSQDNPDDNFGLAA